MSSSLNVSHPQLSWSDFRLLAESLVDHAVFVLGREGQVVIWNGAAEKLCGYRESEIVGAQYSTFFVPEDVAAGKPERAIKCATSFGQIAEEGWRLRGNGTRFWASEVLTALRNANGELIGFGSVLRDLTTSRRAEDELRRSEEHFRLLIENVGDYAIYMLDAQGRITTWNLGAQRLKGYSAAEVIGRDFSLFFPEEDVAEGKPARELSLARTQGRFEDEGWRVRKGGERFWANAILTAVFDARSELVGFVKITRDLTLRREREEAERRLFREQLARELAEAAERKLRESEERYRALSRRLEIVLEGVADGISVQDRSGAIVFANSAAAHACGFDTPEQLIAAESSVMVSNFELVDRAGNPMSFADLPGRRVLAGEQSCTAVFRVIERRTLRTWWTQVRASAVLGADGKPELAVNIWHDVTTEYQHERQAKYLADATSALGGSLDCDIMLAAFTRVFVPGLADYCSIYLLEHNQLRRVASAPLDAATSHAVERYRQRFPSDPERTGGLWNVVQSGVAAVYNDISDELLAVSVEDEERREALRSLGMKAVLIVPIRVRHRVMGVITLVVSESNRRFESGDVTLVEELGLRAGVALENAQLYAAAQQAAHAAEEASRAKDEFLAIVSHELRTPLNAIVGWSALLRERMTDRAANKPIEVIYRNAQAQIRIIDDILDVSRVITGKLRIDVRPTDIVAITRDAIEVVRPSASAKQISLQLETGREFFPIAADPDRMQQAIWNLLSNAVKFTEPKGKVRVLVAQEGSSMVLTVRDSGRGIEPDFLPFVFDRFRQADASVTRRFGGLGLGLALVRHIVELHGGKVAATSQGMNQGSTFTITLPIVAQMPPTLEERERARAGDSNAPGVALNDLRVLVVDDEADARELVAAVLTGAGAVVETASSSKSGLAKFLEFCPHVVVSDIGMPDEDGFTFMRKIRALSQQQGGQVPSLALTALARDEDRRKAIAAGYSAHIGKPVTPVALTSAVAKLAGVPRPCE